jgi:hypothetical protein
MLEPLDRDGIDCVLEAESANMVHTPRLYLRVAERQKILPTHLCANKHKKDKIS